LGFDAGGEGGANSYHRDNFVKPPLVLSVPMCPSAPLVATTRVYLKGGRWGVAPAMRLRSSVTVGLSCGGGGLELWRRQNHPQSPSLFRVVTSRVYLGCGDVVQGVGFISNILFIHVCNVWVGWLWLGLASLGRLVQGSD
jgi:hypothetical protein